MTLPDSVMRRAYTWWFIIFDFNIDKVNKINFNVNKHPAIKAEPNKVRMKMITKKQQCKEIEIR